MRYDLLHPKALRKAVIEHLGTEQDVPQERQFRRWVNGDTPMPGWARRIVDEVMGVQQEAPPAEASGAADELLQRWLGTDSPPWAQGLANQILSAVERDRSAFLDQAAAQYAEIAEMLERGPDSDDAAPPQTRGPQPRKPGPPTAPSA